MKDSDPRNDFVTELFDKYHGTVEHMCLRMVNYDDALRDLADDAIQETFFLAALSYEKLATHENVGGWLCVTARNKMKKGLRGARYHRDIEGASLDENVPETKNAIEEWHDRVHNEEVIARISDALTDAERPVFEDYFQNDFSTRRLADSYGISESAAKLRIHRMRKKAKDIVRKNFPDIFFTLYVTFWFLKELLK